MLSKGVVWVGTMPPLEVEVGHRRDVQERVLADDRVITLETFWLYGSKQSPEHVGIIVGERVPLAVPVPLGDTPAASDPRSGRNDSTAATRWAGRPRPRVSQWRSQSADGRASLAGEMARDNVGAHRSSMGRRKIPGLRSGAGSAGGSRRSRRFASCLISSSGKTGGKALNPSSLGPSRGRGSRGSRVTSWARAIPACCARSSIRAMHQDRCSTIDSPQTDSSREGPHPGLDQSLTRRQLDANAGREQPRLPNTSPLH